jgi:hypothetical protein
MSVAISAETIERLRSVTDLLAGDADLRQRLDELGAPETRMNELVRVARERGVDARVDDFHAILRHAAAADGSLDEEQLAAVAGGLVSVSSMYQMLKGIMEKYDATAKNVIQSLGR